MNTKILYLFKEKQGEYLSGEDISNKLHISRTAVWKHIEKLRGDGYKIEAVPHLGYKLMGLPDVLLADDIKFDLKTKIIGKEILTYSKVDSTNDIAYTLAEKKGKEGTVVIAQQQDKGKGRLARKWISHKGGLYLSGIIRPNAEPSQMQAFTLVTALSVCDAIKEVTALDAKIKWPNDVFIDEKKVCGILCEMKAQPDKIDFIVIGIGINVNNSVDLDTAVSLKQKKGQKIELIDLVQSLLRNLEREYSLFMEKGFKDIRKKIKEHSYTLKRQVKVECHGKIYKGEAVDIDNSGALIIRTTNGKTQKIISGDVL